MHNWKKLIITLRHINIWHNIALKNLILEAGYATTLILQIQCFLPRSISYKCFSKVNLKTYCRYLFFFFGQVEIFSSK